MCPRLVKYPRTPHLPWSPGFTPDDLVVRAEQLDVWVGQEVVVTVKMDGEATTMMNGAIHARSRDGYRSGPAAKTRDVMLRIHGQLQHELPENWRFCGEYLYAEHSLRYETLPAYFMLYNVWTDADECLSWDETEEWAHLLGLHTVPVIWRGVWDKDTPHMLQQLWPVDPLFGESEPEGYVVRRSGRFHIDEFQSSLMKWVRPGHVQTDQHWSHGEIRANGLVEKPAFSGLEDARWPGRPQLPARRGASLLVQRTQRSM